MRYTAEEYDDLNLNEYRERFPDETKALSDERIYEVVMGTEDDHTDGEWRELFTKEHAKS